MKRLVDEEDILKPTDPTLLDDNGWPIFGLVNAHVIVPETGLSQSLLHASEASPVTVTGRLERLDRGEQHYLIDRDVLPANVQVSDVEHFSYGQYDSGEVAFWAAGKAGWFEIRPARPYRDTYKDMTEAINILYFAADFFRGKKNKTLRQLAIDVVFAKYAEDPVFRCPTEARAREAFLKHREVLLELMAQGKENIAWKRTSIYKFLDRESSDSSAVDAATSKATPDRASDGDDIPARLAGKGKSALRLRPASQSHKGAARQKALQDAEEAEEADAEMEDADSQRSRSPLKRKSAQELSTYPVKRSRRRRQNEQDQQDDTTHQNQADSQYTTENDKDAHPPLPLSNIESRLPNRRPNTKPVADAVVDVITTPLPSFEPNTPGDIWTCPFDGCAHRVYGASSGGEQSRGLISEHYANHAHASQAAIDLVHKEERPYLPVSNLIKRIRDMAAKQQAAQPAVEAQAKAGMRMGASLGMHMRRDEKPWMGSTETWSKPIQQKY